MHDAFALYTDVKPKGPFSKTRFLSHYVEGPLSYCICNSHFCFCYAFIHAAFFIVIRISLVGGGGGGGSSFLTPSARNSATVSIPLYEILVCSRNI